MSSKAATSEGALHPLRTSQRNVDLASAQDAVQISFQKFLAIVTTQEYVRGPFGSRCQRLVLEQMACQRRGRNVSVVAVRKGGRAREAQLHLKSVNTPCTTGRQATPLGSARPCTNSKRLLCRHQADYRRVSQRIHGKVEEKQGGKVRTGRSGNWVRTPKALGKRLSK